jgi:hypothetical protein
MCSYVTRKVTIAGSGKGPDGWFRLGTATVYFDHPFHAPYEHTLNIDFANASLDPGCRVAVELSADSARELMRCIGEALAEAEPSPR